MRYLGIDYGDKHIGVAVSNENGDLAFPLEPLSNDVQLMGHISSLVKEKDIKEFVIGESKDFQGNENPIMKKAKEFAGKLEKESGKTVRFEPEFLTSVEARHIQGGSDKTHSSAAAIILQSFLDRKKNNL